ncbi:hypothetical protein D031_2807A, partial [Vibrio parahaemolyticus VP-48]
MMSFIRY